MSVSQVLQSVAGRMVPVAGFEDVGLKLGELQLGLSAHEAAIRGLDTKLQLETLARLEAIAAIGAPSPVKVTSPSTLEKQLPALTVSFSGAQIQVPDRGRLALTVALATAAIASNVQAGNLRWHGGTSDFVMTSASGEAVPMDAPTVIAFGLAVLRG